MTSCLCGRFMSLCVCGHLTSADIEVLPHKHCSTMFVYLLSLPEGGDSSTWQVVKRKRYHGVGQLNGPLRYQEVGCSHSQRCSLYRSLCLYWSSGKSYIDEVPEASGKRSGFETFQSFRLIVCGGTGDRRQETGDRRQETGDRRQETGVLPLMRQPSTFTDMRWNPRCPSTETLVIFLLQKEKHQSQEAESNHRQQTRVAMEIQMGESRDERAGP